MCSTEVSITSNQYNTIQKTPPAINKCIAICIICWYLIVLHYKQLECIMINFSLISALCWVVYGTSDIHLHRLSRGYPAKRALSAMCKHGGWGPLAGYHRFLITDMTQALVILSRVKTRIYRLSLCWIPRLFFVYLLAPWCHLQPLRCPEYIGFSTGILKIYIYALDLNIASRVYHIVAVSASVISYLVRCHPLSTTKRHFDYEVKHQYINIQLWYRTPKNDSCHCYLDQEFQWYVGYIMKYVCRFGTRYLRTSQALTQRHHQIFCFVVILPHATHL